jgi:molybdenum cofactor synthesis domain-containing protein
VIIRNTGGALHVALGTALRLVYAGCVPTAGILIIGNEILSGKVVDTNSSYLCRELRGLGVDVERILTIPDDIDTIASEVKTMSSAYDFLFTSGGVGPTHDDVTIEGVARAFGVAVELSESIADRVRRATGREPNESQLKMAQVPTGATLLDAGDFWVPLVVMENVYIFPGIPELLRRKFESVRERFRGVPFALSRVFVKRHESDIAESLNALLHEFPELLLGSYPRMRKESYHVMRALDSLLERLPADAIHKVE